MTFERFSADAFYADIRWGDAPADKVSPDAFETFVGSRPCDGRITLTSDAAPRFKCN